MRLLTVLGLVLCSLAVIVETKPFIAVKVVPVPVLVPKINIFGLLGKVLHAKAALVGNVVHAKVALVGKVLGAKATLVHHILGSSSGPVIGVVHPPPLFPEPNRPLRAPPLPSPPPTSNDTPPSTPPTSYDTPPSPPPYDAPPSPPPTSYDAPT